MKQADFTQHVSESALGAANIAAQGAFAAPAGAGGVAGAAPAAALPEPAAPAIAPPEFAALAAADEAYMRLALEEARKAADLGEIPIGAVVVYQPINRETRRPLAEPRIIARAHNLRETTRDPAGHAEFLAMKEAARVLEAWRLTDCTVYVTLEPCIMCAGLMHQSRIARCVYGAPDPKAGALGTLYAIHEDVRLNHQFAVTSGILQEECAAALRTFFAQRRKSKAKRPTS